MHLKKTVITQKMTNTVRQTEAIWHVSCYWLLYYVKLL